MIPLLTETALLLSLVYFLDCNLVDCNLVDFIVANYDSITKRKTLHIAFYFIDCNLVGNCSLSSICGSRRLLRPVAGNQLFLLLHFSLVFCSSLLSYCIIFMYFVVMLVEFGSSWIRSGSY